MTVTLSSDERHVDMPDDFMPGDLVLRKHSKFNDIRGVMLVISRTNDSLSGCTYVTRLQQHSDGTMVLKIKLPVFSDGWSAISRCP